MAFPFRTYHDARTTGNTDEAQAIRLFHVSLSRAICIVYANGSP